ncbi:hypothetical protein HII36_54240 [Nonomuraea sp. NN258]|uniref:hypothetical protein n=1 Tax=Nonomuraea antri TaxID=2730852 RepID=UPI001568C93B|nr:hypothetical protein [Nonomuraea antri]NRQ40712.1 hypothetical protein [Nonomuraea antri]
MSLVAAEGVKLLSTPSPKVLAAAAVVVPVAFAGLVAGSAGDPAAVTVAVSQAGFQFGMAPILALAVASITTEYRYHTIKATFLAVPGRGSVLAAKAAVTALACAALGLVAAFCALGVAALLAPRADLALDTAADWRNVAGVAAYYAGAAVIAVAIGAVVRHTAGALILVLGYAMFAESLVPAIPGAGLAIHRWLPFNVGKQFLTGGPDPGMPPPGPPAPPPSTALLGPWWALVYYVGFALVLLGVAAVVVRRRDA